MPFICCVCVCLHVPRLLPDPAVFSGTLSVLCLVQVQGDEPTPLCILRAALYLLSVTQDGSPELASVRHAGNEHGPVWHPDLLGGGKGGCIPRNVSH